MTKKVTKNVVLNPLGHGFSLDNLDPVTLVELRSKVDPVDEDVRVAIYHSVAEAYLAELGTRVKTEDILGDAALFCHGVHQIYQRLPQDKRPLLVGFAPELLSVLVDEALKLDTKNRAYDLAKQTGTTSKATAEQALRTASRAALLLRDEAARAVIPYASEQLRAQLTSIKGTADSPQNLNAGVTGVAGVLRHCRKNAPPQVRVLMDKVGLSDAYAESLDKAGAEVLEAEKKLQAVNAEPTVTQRELDLQDGRVLHLMKIILTAFEAGHVRDESTLVPPINRLRNVLKGYRKKVVEVETNGAGTSPKDGMAPMDEREGS